MKKLCAALIAMCFVCAVAQDEPIFDYDWSYREATETSGATSYIFEGEATPPLLMTDGGALANITDVNNILDAIGLPTVPYVAPEGETLTGSRFNRGEYVWNDYPEGELVIERKICERTENTKGFFAAFRAIREDYDCVWKVSIR